MAGNFHTFDYGNVLANAEAIKGQRLRNRILGRESQEQANVIANRERAREIRQQIEGMPAQIEAMERAGLQGEADALRESYLRTRIQGVQMIDTMRDVIDETNWKAFRSDMIRSGTMDGAMLPVEYDANWFRQQREEQIGDLKTITLRWGDEEGRIVERMLAERDGQVVWEGDPYETTGSQSERRQQASAGQSEAFTVEAADSNAITRAAAELYGGFYDPVTQRFEGLRGQEQNVLSVAEEASRIYAENQGRLPHSQAVAEAARVKGIDIERLGPRSIPNPRDPAGILD